MNKANDWNRPSPDYWQALDADLRAAAGRIAGLAGQPSPDIDVTLSVDVRGMQGGDEERRRVVDAIAAAFDITAADVKDGPSWARRTCGRVGELRVTVSTRITAPENAELVALRARVAELEAERTGGAR